MRIDKVHIKSRFKNLNDFKIDIDENSMETVLLGANATGKSNFMEALVVIFRDLDLESDPPFEYYIKYKCRDNDIEVEYSKKEGYQFIINGFKLKSKQEFAKGKDDYLPKHIFIYYSGQSERLKSLYIPHQRIYYKEIIEEKSDYSKFDTIRRIFLVHNIHASFALLAFFMFKDREAETLDFLKQVLRIKEFGSALFVLKQPIWSKVKSNNDRFWNAKGLVRNFLNDLWEHSLAPIYNDERVPVSYKQSITENRLYLFLSNKTAFKKLVESKYTNKILLFNALESLEISDLIHDVKVRVIKDGVPKELAMSELSEGEKQLLTVLGLLKFTRDEESLILLDEPDTHLNPQWKWMYLDYLDKVVQRHESTQILFCTHDPLVIGGMNRSQVKIFKLNNEGKTEVYTPAVSPNEMSVSKILTSELFGIPSLMSKELEDKLNRKRFLQNKSRREGLDQLETEEYSNLADYLEEVGFYDTTTDSRYNLFLKLTNQRKEFTERTYTKEEEQELERIASEVMDEIMKST